MAAREIITRHMALLHEVMVVNDSMKQLHIHLHQVSKDIVFC